MKFSVIVAAHNEEESIGQLLQELTTALKSLEGFEIFVSEDGSKDRTREIVSEAIAQEPRIRLSSISKRRGYSGAIQHGILESRGEILLFLDGDGQTNPADLAHLINYLQSENQIIVGSRHPRVDSSLRLIESKLFNLLYRLLGFPKLADPSSGSIVCYRNSILDIAKKELRLPFGFWWEFQAWVGYYGLEVTEIPIPHRNRIAGTTQVYLNSKIMKIALTHIFGLFHLKKDLRLGSFSKGKIVP